jgi:hypothetical protein
MTARQQEIKRLLDDGLGAREIADLLGITRNAVHQQIQRLRRNGELPAGFTPSGQAPRETMPGSRMLERAMGMESAADDVAKAGAIALLHEIKHTRDELNGIVYRLSSMLPR